MTSRATPQQTEFRWRSSTTESTTVLMSTMIFDLQLQHHMPSAHRALHNENYTLAGTMAYVLITILSRPINCNSSNQINEAASHLSTTQDACE
jgi:L-asparagine transporter-like permease